MQTLIYESLLSLVKARKILQQNFDQDAAGGLVGLDIITITLVKARKRLDEAG